MEVDKAKNDTTVMSIDNVLAIGDKNTYLKFKKSVKHYDNKNFKEDCIKRFSLLLLGTQNHINVVDGSSRMDWIGLTEIRKNNQCNFFHFYCGHTKNPDVNSWSFNVINAEAVLHEVRKQLKNENWISKYMIEAPLKARLGRQDSYSQQYYIQRAICEANDLELAKISRYVHHLHNQYKEDKRKN